MSPSIAGQIQDRDGLDAGRITGGAPSRVDEAADLKDENDDSGQTAVHKTDRAAATHPLSIHHSYLNHKVYCYLHC